MRRIGIICTNDTELDPLMKRGSDLGRDKRGLYTVYKGAYADQGALMVRCGGGKLNAACAAQYLIGKYDVGAILVCGIVSGLGDDVEPLDTIVCTESVLHDGNASVYDKYPVLKDHIFRSDEALCAAARTAADNVDWAVLFGRISTGESAPEGFGWQILCSDSESAAAAHACYLSGVPFIAVRTVADASDESRDQAAARSAQFVIKLMEAMK